MIQQAFYMFAKLMVGFMATINPACLSIAGDFSQIDATDWRSSQSRFTVEAWRHASDERLPTEIPFEIPRFSWHGLPGTKDHDAVLIGMWSKHFFAKSDFRENHNLLGIQYNGYYLVSFVNSHDDKTLSAGNLKDVRGNPMERILFALRQLQTGAYAWI